MKNFIKISLSISLLGAIFIMSGCGGATFVKGATSLKPHEKVGVLVDDFQIRAQQTFGAGHISNGTDARAASLMAAELKESLARRGFDAQVIPVDSHTAELVAQFKAQPRNFRHVLSDPGAVSLGDLKALFQHYGIEHLMVVEGESDVYPTIARGLVAEAVAAGELSTKDKVDVAFIGSARTIIYTAVVEVSGNLAFYNREQFTQKDNNDFYGVDHRRVMADHAVDSWLAASK